ncbi:hypothetical protein CAEBREN_21215 [Caenorhabditis brenneri]|uniref:Uncharacterized protein n=1 Tax=Caenorhabditis brenneri TaxID=135651 RepID=G0PKM3_CAEBE|nr:hypothetical protein CAEBREN_21215 [Caenorhabditis brenneri]
MLGNFEGVENSVLPSHNGNLQINLSPKNELPDESFNNILKIYANILDSNTENNVEPVKDKLLQSSLNHCYSDISMNNLDGIMEAFRLYSSLGTDS